MSSKDYNPIELIPDDSVTFCCDGRNGKGKTLTVPRRQVYQMAACGMMNVEMSKMFSCTAQTLVKYFGFELNAARSDFRLSLRRQLRQLALDEEKPNIVALLFLSKNYLKMSDNGMTEDVEEIDGVEFKVRAPAVPQVVKPIEKEISENP